MGLSKLGRLQDKRTIHQRVPRDVFELRKCTIYLEFYEFWFGVWLKLEFEPQPFLKACHFNLRAAKPAFCLRRQPILELWKACLWFRRLWWQFGRFVQPFRSSSSKQCIWKTRLWRHCIWPTLTTSIYFWTA